MIEEYHFGSITIDGKIYTHDVEVRWNGEVLDWWRGESHLFSLTDIQRVLEKNPDVLIFGTGAYGIANLSEEVEQEIRKRGIDLIVGKTDEAIKNFNLIKGKGKKVIGLFHLTC